MRAKLLNFIVESALTEGVYDPAIFKAIILAGGPGSGKTFVANRTLRGHGFKFVNSDTAYEMLLKKNNLSTDMTGPQYDPNVYEPLRHAAKGIAKTQEDAYISGRLGLVIDGTGKEYDKIAKLHSKLTDLGYDVFMVFVNTSLDVAMARNQNRERKVPADVVKSSWEQVQNNIGKFQSLFGNKNFRVVDNNNAGENVFNSVWKEIMGYAKRPIENIIAKRWIATQMANKKRT